MCLYGMHGDPTHTRTHTHTHTHNDTAMLSYITYSDSPHKQESMKIIFLFQLKTK